MIPPARYHCTDVSCIIIVGGGGDCMLQAAGLLVCKLQDIGLYRYRISNVTQLSSLPNCVFHRNYLSRLFFRRRKYTKIMYTIVTYSIRRHCNNIIYRYRPRNVRLDLTQFTQRHETFGDTLSDNTIDYC